jgi:hypothetical protein
MQSATREPRRKVVWFAALIACALLLWWLALAAPDRADESSVVEVPNRAPREVAASKVPSAAPPTAAVAPAATAPEATPSAPATPPAEPPRPAERGPAVPIPPDTRGFVDAIQERYERDTRDRAAGDYENALHTMFRGPDLPAGLLRSVACRQSVCKLEVYWRAEYDAPYRRLVDDLAAGNAKMVATRVEGPDKAGGVPVDLYWLRGLSEPPTRRLGEKGAPQP